MIQSDETIAAISTPAGKGGIGIIRISGSASLRIALKIFASTKLQNKIEERKLYFGKLVDRDQRFLDHGYLAYFKSPESYTGEDTVEISCHGSPFILRVVLEEAAHAGARIAEPGEFTMRAFLNGRIDLIQAEAIKNLIDARTYYQARVAYNQLEGELSKKILPVKDQLINNIAEAEAALDFADEDNKFISKKEFSGSIDVISLNIKDLIESFREGRIIQEGAIVAIVGAPNVGKSSIFNQLLKYDRAIVTDVPGTTRDTVEETIDVEGIPVRLIDTAGLREASNVVEKEGVQRSEHAIRRADLILYVLDSSGNISKEELEFFRRLSAEKVIVVENKQDLKQNLDESLIPKRFTRVAKVSAMHGAGIQALNRTIRNMISTVDENSLSASIVTNVRHAELLKQALHSLNNAKESLENEMSEEYILIDLKRALQNINELTGETTIEDIYDRIFSKFCLGK